MKKLLSILPVFFFTLVVNAQPEDIAKGKTFGNYKGIAIIIPEIDRNAKSIKGQTIITGMVVGMCKAECCTNKRTSCSADVKSNNGIVTIGTGASGFTIPRSIEGRTITVEAIGADQISGRKRRDVKFEYRENIQFAATGIKLID